MIYVNAAVARTDNMRHMCPTTTAVRPHSRSRHESGDPQSFIAYAPRGFGLLCALVYAMRGDDVFGWWIGPVDNAYQPSYFLVSDYYSRNEGAFYTTRGGDLYGGWVRDYDARYPDLDKPVPVEDELAHRLERMQFVFAQEWLSFSGDKAARIEAERYREAELAHQDVNLRFDCLGKLDKDQPVWIYRSPKFDTHVLRRLARNWPLLYWGLDT